MLTFTLKKEWYDRILSGDKTIEYRRAVPYWNKRLYNATLKSYMDYDWPGAGDYALFRKAAEQCGVWFKPEDKPTLPCILRLGYTRKHMTARVLSIHIEDGANTDLHIAGPVWAICLGYMREAQE